MGETKFEVWYKGSSKHKNELKTPPSSPGGEFRGLTLDINLEYLIFIKLSGSTISGIIFILSLLAPLSASLKGNKGVKRLENITNYCVNYFIQDYMFLVYGLV